MNKSPPSDPDLLNALAEAFLERYRHGERPSLTEYADRHPDLAGRIREVFPVLIMMEGLAPEVAPPSTPATGPPRQLGEYRILREVGRGGMGVVYEAVQETLGRQVALKVLSTGPRASGAALERFRREAKAAARLHHTNIVPVFGVGEADGVHYYAMQFIHGHGLDAVLHDIRRLRGDRTVAGRGEATSAAAGVARSLVTGVYEAPSSVAGGGSNGSASGGTTASYSSTHSSELVNQSETRYFREIARLGMQAADALAYAHAQGILHRDVKPSNLLLDTQGTLWVTDFGLAKAEDSEDLTHEGDIVGTLRYMAPERFQGRADSRSDVYALGVTLYELLTLRPAFADADRVALIDSVTRESPPTPRRVDPRIPRDLETIVLKATAKAPSDRYATAADVADDLRRFLADRSILARRHSMREQAWRWCRRNPAVAALTGAVAALLVAVAVGSTIAAVWLSTALTRAVDAEHKGKMALWEARKAEAHGTRVVSRRAGQRFDSLATIAKAVKLGQELGLGPEKFDELRTEAIAALALADMDVTYWWDGLPEGCNHPNFSEDVTLYCRTEPDGSVAVRTVDGDTSLCRLPAEGGPTRGFLSPDGRFAVQRHPNGHYAVWRLGPEPQLLGRVEQPGLREWVWFHPKRDLFAVWSPERAVTVFELPSVRPVYHFPADGRPGVIETTFHPTESLVAQSCYLSRPVEVRDLATGKVVATWVPPWIGGAGVCAWHPDGRTLAVPQGDGPATILVEFDPVARTFGRHSQVSGETPGGSVAQFNHAGDRLLVSTDWGDDLHLYDVGTGRKVFELPPAVQVIHRPRFDRSDRRLAGARKGSQLGLWSIGDGREYRVLAPGRTTTGHARPPVVSADGRIIAANAGDGLILLDLITGRELAVVPFRPQGINAWRAGALAFDSSGSLLTNSIDGFFRWPLRPDPSVPGRLRIGPPERLPFFEGSGSIAVSRDDQVIIQSMFGGYGEGQYAGGWILHPDRPSEPRRVAEGLSMGDGDVSPDGRWAAFAMHFDRVLVFETATGQEVWQSPQSGRHCRFTPDGRWLATGVDGCRVYAVGTWQPGPRLGPGQIQCISPDSRLAVMSLSEGAFRLVEVETGREIARLEDPDRQGGRGAWLAASFTPDGTRLVAAARDGLRVWDLRAIRKELAALDLDWAAPPYPPAEGPTTEPPPLTVEVVGAALLNQTTRMWWNLLRSTPQLLDNPDDTTARFRRAVAAQRLGWPWMAMHDYGELLERRPDDLAARYQRAKVALKLGRPADAVADFGELLRRDPEDYWTRHDRATTLIRLGRHREAVPDLDLLISLFPPNAEFFRLRGDCHARLGNHAATIADSLTVVDLLPDDLSAISLLAWRLVIGPERHRDPEQALPLAERVVKLAPQQWKLHNTLGVVYYRLGRFTEAVNCLSASLEHGTAEMAGYDLYVLAMCHHRLGDASTARDYFERGVKWQQKTKVRPEYIADANALKAEAAALLGISQLP